MSSQRRRTNALILWTCSSAAAGASIGAAIALPAHEQTPVIPLLLVAAIGCLFTAWRQLRNMRQPRHDHADPTRPGAVALAVGGPCDGQQFDLPHLGAAPIQIWLADKSPDGTKRHHLYSLEQASDTIVRYRYEPPQRQHWRRLDTARPAVDAGALWLSAARKPILCAAFAVRGHRNSIQAKMGCVAGDGASSYGDRHASVYDRIYGSRFAPDAAVDALALAAGDGAVLELGLGTGRLAIPLAARGVVVDGIEGSSAMIERLPRQPRGQRVGVYQVDLADFDLPRSDYAVSVCAVSTLFMLTHEDQRTAIRAAARHLRAGGRLFVEAFRPDPTRFDSDGRRVEARRPAVGSHVVRSVHDAVARSIRIEHEMTDDTGVQTYQVTLYYATPEELDVMAVAAGLRLVGWWHDWAGDPARADSTDPVSVYERV